MRNMYNKLTKIIDEYPYRTFFTISFFAGACVIYLHTNEYYVTKSKNEDLEKVVALFLFVIGGYGWLFSLVSQSDLVKRIFGLVFGVRREDLYGSQANIDLGASINVDGGVKIEVPRVGEFNIEDIPENRSKIPAYMFSKSDALLSDNIDRMGRASSTINIWTFLNLILGSVLALFGIYVLSTLDWSELATVNFDEEGWKAIFQLVARILLVIIIEVFAYFFLSLYRDGLRETKYFQNEITNIIHKRAGMRAVFFEDDPKFREMIADALLNAERNFILRKGESAAAPKAEAAGGVGTDKIFERAVASVEKVAVEAVKAVKPAAGSSETKKDDDDKPKPA